MYSGACRQLQPNCLVYHLHSLAEIGEVMSRPLVGMEEEPSQLERLCLACRAAVDGNDSDESDASSCSGSATSERSWDANGSASGGGLSEHGLSDEDGLYDELAGCWGDGWGGGGGGSRGLARSCSARGADSSSLPDIPADGSAGEGLREAASGAAQQDGSGSTDQLGSWLQLLGLAAAQQRPLAATGGGSLERLDPWQQRSGGLQGNASASVPDLASAASGTLSTASNFRRLSSGAAGRMPGGLLLSGADELLFELDDGGPSHIARSGSLKTAGSLNAADAGSDLARRHSSPVGSLELPPPLAPQVSRGSRSSGDVQLSPRTPAALHAVSRAVHGWGDSSSPETPSPDTGAQHLRGSAAAASPFMLAPCRPPGLPPALPARPRSAMGGLARGGASGRFPYGSGDAATAATEGPMAMSLALPSTVQRPRRPMQERRHHRHAHHHKVLPRTCRVVV